MQCFVYFEDYIAVVRKTETVGCFAKLIMRMLSKYFGGDRQLLTAFFHKFQLVREYVAIKITGKPAQFSVCIPKIFNSTR